MQRNNKPKSTKKSEHDYIHNRTSKLLGILKIVKSTCVLSLLMNVNLMIMHWEFYLQPKCTLCNAYTLSEHFWVSRLSVKLQLIWIALWPFVILNVKMIKDQLKFNGCKCFPELTVVGQLNWNRGVFFFNKNNIFTSTLSGEKKPTVLIHLIYHFVFRKILPLYCMAYSLC